MRLTSMLSATAIAIYFATCAADADQTKIVIKEASVHAEDSADRRFLRAHREDAAIAEERTSHFNVIGMTKKKKALELIDELLENERLTKAAYIWWQHNQHTLTDIDKFLKLTSQIPQDPPRGFAFEPAPTTSPRGCHCVSTVHQASPGPHGWRAGLIWCR
ncbi:RxLR effector protein [Phytophthora megakarya]|uniref:RxLR effector protein n=1 Tax=Phytophthora megakarya TaxID=4795 RepID=A0A225VXD6_9STRA|nr:RxLR effector protein [Phytophthora megakarya]